MTTYLPGLTGFLMLVAALPDAIRGRALPVSVVAALAGSFVVVTGFLARVTRIDADLHGLAIRYAARPPVRLPWPTVLALRGPSTVLGGWRVEAGSGRGRTLMPSDLLGLEQFLWVTIQLSWLRFDCRRWSSDPPPEDTLPRSGD